LANWVSTNLPSRASYSPSPPWLLDKRGACPPSDFELPSTHQIKVRTGLDYARRACRSSSCANSPSSERDSPSSTIWQVKAIHEEFHYACPPAELFALISSGALQLETIAHLGGMDTELVEQTLTPDGGVKLVTRQRTGVELPGFAKRLVPASTTVTQTYIWEPAGEDGSREWIWSAEIKGAPFRWEGRPSCVRADRAPYTFSTER